MNIISNYQVDGHTATKEDRLRKIQELTESGDESVVSHNMDIAFQLFTLGRNMWTAPSTCWRNTASTRKR